MDATSPAALLHPGTAFTRAAVKDRVSFHSSREDLARGYFVDDAYVRPFSGRLSKRRILDPFPRGESFRGKSYVSSICLKRPLNHIIEHQYTGRAARGPVRRKYNPVRYPHML